MSQELDANGRRAISVVLYSKPGCHLCDEMKALLERVSRRTTLTVEEVDISADAELERVYGMEIPVLMIAGRKAAKHRITEAELLRKLNDYASGQIGRAHRRWFD